MQQWGKFITTEKNAGNYFRHRNNRFKGAW